jgi:hypothetical protein
MHSKSNQQWWPPLAPLNGDETVRIVVWRKCPMATRITPIAMQQNGAIGALRWPVTNGTHGDRNQSPLVATIGDGAIKW